MEEIGPRPLFSRRSDQDGQVNLPVLFASGSRHAPHVPRRRGSHGRQSGFVTLMMASLILPMIGMLGLIFDIGQTRLVRERLVDALRTAALSGAREFDSGERENHIRAVLELNFPTSGTPMYGVSRPQTTGAEPRLSDLPAPISNWTENPRIVFTDDAEDHVRVGAALTVPTLLMRVVSPELRHMTVVGFAHAVRRGTPDAYTYALQE